MSVVTDASRALRAAFVEHRDALDDVLRRHGATDARLFGSVARGDATPSSDCDVLVELDPAGGNELLRIAGIGEDSVRYSVSASTSSVRDLCKPRFRRAHSPT